MDGLKIEGGKPLRGEIRISGAKNAALPLLCLGLMTSDRLVLENAPKLADTVSMEGLLRHHGVRVARKDEIVTMGKKNINPSTQSGEYINHKRWNALIEDKNTLLIDTRNSYEYAIGTFKNSINPKTANFKEFPEWVNKQQFSETDKKQKKVAMFCTGGIRCEKASAFMKNEGFEKVYHLKGGILKYLEEIETRNSLWQGECFVFDDRVSVKHDLSEGSYDLCHGCRMPITEQDKLSSHYVKGVSCSNCVNEKTSSQIKRYKTRQKQINLAKAKNKNHLGPKVR